MLYKSIGGFVNSVCALLNKPALISYPNPQSG